MSTQVKKEKGSVIIESLFGIVFLTLCALAGTDAVLLVMKLSDLNNAANRGYRLAMAQTQLISDGRTAEIQNKITNGAKSLHPSFLSITGSTVVVNVSNGNSDPHNSNKALSQAADNSAPLSGKIKVVVKGNYSGILLQNFELTASANGVFLEPAPQSTTTSTAQSKA